MASGIQYSQYFHELDNQFKTRYRQKIDECGGVDPYSNAVQYDDDVFLWPPVQYPDIVNYLVCTTSFVSGREMKAYKSLSAYNFFVSGWVRNITAKTAHKGRVIIFARVNHSQRASESPLKTWVLIEATGEVVTGHCDCMGGLCEVCSHIGAVLFALEAGTCMRDTQTCTEKSCKWILPPTLKEVPYVEVRNIDFSSAKKKKTNFDTNLTTPVALRNISEQAESTGHKPTEEESLQFLSEVSSSGVKSAILSVHPNFCDAFVPVQKLPKDLTCLFDYEALELQFNELISLCKDVEKNIEVTEEMALNVERLTRDQASSKEWFSYRSGRITASKMKSACHTDPANPSISLINSICNPSQFRFTTQATKWGCDHEKTAQSLYFKHQEANHEGFCGRDSGLHLNPDYPFLGASPDGTVQCNCCGNGVCEIKCPFCNKDETIQEMARSSKSCMQGTSEGIKLDRSHSYYYQVQSQIFLCKAKYCDFVVMTNKEISIERIYPDTEFWERVVPKAHHFFQVAILPELVGKWYSSKTMKAQAVQDHGNQTVFCYCRKEEPDKSMVSCSNKDCMLQRFHLNCLGLKKAPKAKNWLCPSCRKMPEVKKNMGKLRNKTPSRD